MAPKTSLFPPNRQKIKRAEEARKNQIKTMGDLEFTADMQPQFVGQMTQEQKNIIGGENPEKSKFREIYTYLDDPIAQYGFDPDRIRLQEPDKYQIQNVWSSKQPTTTDANAEYNPGYTKTGPNRLDIEKDIIKYGVKLGNSKEIIAHEARHRGFQLLRDMQLEGSEEDQKAWIKKYGREAAGLLDIYFSRDPRHKFSAETINEIRDRPDAKFNPPKFDAEGNPPNMGLFRGGDRNAAIQFVPTEDLRESKKSGRIQFSGDFTDPGGNLRASLSNEFINKAFQGLDKAAKDAMKKQKDDYRKKMTVRSQEGKRKFANGGSVEDQTGQAFKGMGYGEIIADNLIGLDNEYESLGEKIGKQFNQDEAAFLKKMGVSMYEGAKDFISAPIETTKEGFKEFATGTTDFLFKDLDTRLQEMFKTDYNNATPEQVTKARESVLGDAVIASGILPAGKVIGNVVEGAVDIGTNAARKIDLSKVNSAIARANEIAEDVEGKADQSILGEGYRLVAKERMGKGRGKQNSAQTAAALNLGYTEIGFHSTRRYNPNEEIEVFKLPDEVFADRAADKGITLQELLDNEGLTFNNKNNAHDFLGVHVGTTKAAADRFSDLSFEKGLPEMEGSRTYQLRLKTNKPFLDGKKPWTEKGLNTFLVKEMNKIKSGQVYEKMQIVRRRLAEQGYTHVPYINNVEDKRNISYAMLVDRPEGGGVNSSAVIRYKDAEFNPLEKFNRNAKFAQGGVAMKDQMEMSFGRAETVDPVSGNDVPPGSLPIEVRDNIPARLSEGEYVVPADVVRFFGVKYFEDLRAEAKIGLQQMDADGRIGGEPIDSPQTELSDKDLDEIIRQAAQQEQQQPMMANKGGVVGYQGGGYEFPDYTTKPRFVGQSVFGINPIYQDTSEEDKKSAADKIIEDAKTEVLPVCPPGQTYDKSRQMCMPDNTDDSNDTDPDRDPDASKTSTTWGIDKATGAAIDFSSADALAKYSKSFNTPFADGYATDKSVLAGLAAISPGIALATGVVGGFDETTDLAAMKASRISAAIYGHNELVKTIGEDIEKYEKKTGDGLGSKSLGIGQGYNWSALANGITRKEVKTFMDLYEEVYSPGGTKTQEDLTSLEKLRVKLLEKSKAARKPSREKSLAADKQFQKFGIPSESYRDEEDYSSNNVSGGPLKKSLRPQTRPSNLSVSGNNDDSNDDGDGGSVAADFTNTGPDFESGGLYQTGGLVQRRKKKK